MVLDLRPRQVHNSNRTIIHNKSSVLRTVLDQLIRDPKAQTLDVTLRQRGNSAATSVLTTPIQGETNNLTGLTVRSSPHHFSREVGELLSQTKPALNKGDKLNPELNSIWEFLDAHLQPEEFRLESLFKELLLDVIKTPSETPIAKTIEYHSGTHGTIDLTAEFNPKSKELKISKKVHEAESKEQSFKFTLSDSDIALIARLLVPSQVEQQGYYKLMKS